MRLPLLLLLSALTIALATKPSSASTPTADPLELQRQQFQAANNALNKRQFSQFRQLKSKLKDYPLYPYLEFKALKGNIRRAKKSDVRAFLENNKNSPLAIRLRKHWLNSLVRRGRWSDYLEFYQVEQASIKEQCRWVTAHLKAGKALPEKTIEQLWNVDRSQPKVCDPGFKAWKAAGKLTPQIAWQRHHKAMLASKLSLAAYVRKQMPKSDQKLAELHADVYRNPKLLKLRSRFRSNTDRVNAIILHGFRRYAKTSPLAAVRLWESYDAQRLFPEQDRLETLYVLAKRLAQKNHSHEASKLLKQYKQIDNVALTELLIRESLADQDWKSVQHWIAKLPKTKRQTHDWQYWLARSIEQQGETSGPQFSPHAIYSKLAQHRDYYGFLAADRIKSEYQLQDMPLIVDQQRINKLKQQPAIKRIYELYQLGWHLWANREWYHISQKLAKTDAEALASLTHEWGWHLKTIQGMASVKYWDDLQMRFPLAYESELKRAAKVTKINTTLLFAIARQESAFTPYARSPAGAMGLMQIMPATAKQTAKKMGLSYRRSDLLQPKRNIALGSNYLNQLLKQFKGNRFLAAAAYNAGPHRVKRWLKNSDSNLPYDVWIETIPYKETRGYVQNVLEYSVIYAYRMGTKTRLMKTNELKHL